MFIISCILLTFANAFNYLFIHAKKERASFCKQNDIRCTAFEIKNFASVKKGSKMQNDFLVESSRTKKKKLYRL